MRPEDIARLIIEDVAINNGLISETGDRGESVSLREEIKTVRLALADCEAKLAEQRQATEAESKRIIAAWQEWQRAAEKERASLLGRIHWEFEHDVDVALDALVGENPNVSIALGHMQRMKRYIVSLRDDFVQAKELVKLASNSSSGRIGST